jgi:predicted alpha/beta-hydrolase family hydrolase
MATAIHVSGDVSVRGFLHEAGSGTDALVLTHGAGGNCNAQLLVALGEEFAKAGVNVLRCDLPFRQARPNGPPSPANAAKDQEGLARAVEVMRGRFSGRVFLGGQSYGGRQASMLAAGDSGIVDGLLLLSYPLHPPGKAAQQRTAHLPAIKMPCLFVSGTKDPFGSPDELHAAIKLVPAPTRFMQVPNEGHSLLSKRNRDELPRTIVQEFVSFFFGQEKTVTNRTSSSGA